MTTATTHSHRHQEDRARWLALYVLCAGVLMIVLDATIVNVALPSIQSDLGFSQSSLAWVVNAYLIPFGGLLLLAGRLGDLVGRKRVFLIGLAVFTGASLLCGLAQSEAVLNAGMWLVGSCYNFCWYHTSLRERAPAGAPLKWDERTPAMAAGLTDHQWTMRELLMYQVPPPPWMPPKRRGRPPKQPPAVTA